MPWTVGHLVKKLKSYSSFDSSLAQGLKIKKNAFRNFHFLISAASLVYRWGSICKTQPN